MNRVSDLNMIKGQDIVAQRAVIDELASRFSLTVDGIDIVLSEIPKDDLVDLSAEAPGRAIRYALLAIIAADIATVPYQEGRNFHMRRLEELASIFGLSTKKIVHLTRYADQWMTRFEALEGDAGIR
jgi:hypothetical protein